MLFSIKMMALRREMTDGGMKQARSRMDEDVWDEDRWQEWVSLVYRLSDNEVAMLLSCMSAISTDMMPVFTIKMALYAVFLRIYCWVRQLTHL